MSQIIPLKTFSDSLGDLTVIENELPFKIKRFYYIYNCDGSPRGYHGHKKTYQAIVCLGGSVDFYSQDKSQKTIKYVLDKPDICLLVEPSDFHWFDNFTKDAIILVMASELFDENDYVYER